MGNSSIRLTYDQIEYIMKRTDITDPNKAIEYFAELLIMERISPSSMGVVVTKLMERDRKKIK